MGGVRVEKRYTDIKTHFEAESRPGPGTVDEELDRSWMAVCKKLKAQPAQQQSPPFEDLCTTVKDAACPKAACLAVDFEALEALRTETERRQAWDAAWRRRNMRVALENTALATEAAVVAVASLTPRGASGCSGPPPRGVLLRTPSPTTRRDSQTGNSNSFCETPSGPSGCSTPSTAYSSVAVAVTTSTSFEPVAMGDGPPLSPLQSNGSIHSTGS